MGALSLPAAGVLYVDAQVVIYSVTNDYGLRGVTTLPLVVLQDLLTP